MFFYWFIRGLIYSFFHQKIFIDSHCSGPLLSVGYKVLALLWSRHSSKGYQLLIHIHVELNYVSMNKEGKVI